MSEKVSFVNAWVLMENSCNSKKNFSLVEMVSWF